MTKTNSNSDIYERLKKLEIISNPHIFKLISSLTKHEYRSFSQLKADLNLNPNALHRLLGKLLKEGLVSNFYAKSESQRHYSFYKLTDKAQNTLLTDIGTPRILETMIKFKRECNSKDWRALEKEDLIEVDGMYHSFILTRNIRPSVFKRVACSRKFAIPGERGYKVVDVAYTAWLFLERLPKELTQLVFKKEPSLAVTNSIYDLAQAYLVEPEVIVFNRTDSEVFQEFERFLENKWSANLVDGIATFEIIMK